MLKNNWDPAYIHGCSWVMIKEQNSKLYDHSVFMYSKHLSIQQLHDHTSMKSNKYELAHASRWSLFTTWSPRTTYKHYWPPVACNHRSTPGFQLVSASVKEEKKESSDTKWQGGYSPMVRADRVTWEVLDGSVAGCYPWLMLGYLWKLAMACGHV